MPPLTEVVVTIDTLLLESDLPDLVIARDKVGTSYLCALTGSDEEGHSFLAVQISSDRLAALRSGHIDLRLALVEPEMGVCFEGRTIPEMDPERDRIRLLALQANPPEEWLPDPGFMLSAIEGEASDEEVVRDAIARNAPVIVCRVNPPEARGLEAKIDADDLSDYVGHFQSLVRHAFKNIIKKIKETDRKVQIPEDAFKLNVFAFSRGSFQIHFEARDRPDLFGSSTVGLAMQQVDELMSLSSKPAEEALVGFRKNPGHVLAAYEALMKFASERAPFEYRWSDPGMTEARGGFVTPTQAASMVAVLAREDTLRVERFAFRGYFTSVNTDRKPWSWTAHDVEAKVRRG